ncbi:hypothetical protein BD311DRAFT_376620 [Dichomitus squalens]|uniref:Uncharacterized protein n=1 Tax=Dichomitus squalens TaxID=114155 RepID=A0A4Q9MN71_9APHY|nr:hypothetical protein BD311DRAFT_376620 [Dichomitus squalens]
MTIYFALRFPAEYYPAFSRPLPIDSWMAFNTWPCGDAPSWSSRIGVIPRHFDHGARHVPAWKVWLRSLTFQPMGYREDGGILEGWCRIVFTNRANPNGLRVLLDTGASISTLPHHAIQTMHSVLFKNEGSVPVAQRGDPNWHTYTVNELLSREGQVRYEFGGYNGESPVIVLGPMQGFVYLKYPPPTIEQGTRFEGLIFPMVPAETDVATLGVNFFQTMYVALTKAKTSLHYVQLAAQWPENWERDLAAYVLPS